MALVESIKLEHVPPSTRIYAALFTSLTNAPFLRAQLLAGNTEFSYALIDARSVISTTHLFAAVFRALNDSEAGRLKSRNVHSEVVFNLSPNNNIADSFRRFGISDDTKDLIIIKICCIDGDHADPTDQPTWESVTAHLTENIKGQPVPVSDAAITTISDLDYIAKLYKVPVDTTGEKAKSGSTNVQNVANGHDTESQREWKRRRIESAALGAMALKGS